MERMIGKVIDSTPDSTRIKSRIAAVSADIAALAVPGGVLADEPMKNHTSFRIGGPADMLVMPRDTDALISVLNICKSEGIPCHILGNGTNTIVSDKGFRGIVIVMSGGFNVCKVLDEGIIEAEAGILLIRLSTIALEESLAGLEFASGIPGTLGGAVYMNAGAYGGEMKDVVEWTQYLDENNNMRELTGDRHCFGYRSSCFTDNPGIILKSRLKLKKGDKDAIRALMNELSGRRKANQPLDIPSAGSVFKRAAGYNTWNLIEGCGLRGYSIGGAQISRKHCGFIVNTGSATAEDVVRLIEYIRKNVMEKYNVDLHPEVKIIGEQ